MTDAIVAIILFTLIAVGVLAVQLVNALARRRWRAHDQYPFLVSELGFERTQDRFLVDTRIQRYAGNHRGRQVEIEVGSGSHGVYLRLDFEFEKHIDLGLRVSSESEDGFGSRLLRLKELEIGHQHFDSQFILLCRDETRLKELLDPDVRRMLLDLNTRVRELRLNDNGLHLQLFGAIEDDVVRTTIDLGVQLAGAVYVRASELQEQRREEIAASGTFAPVTGSMAAIGIEDAR